MAFKPIDPKRDEFRRYLERSGVVEKLTKVFVRLAIEQPENPMDYLRQTFEYSLNQADDVALMQSQLEEARAEIERLRSLIYSRNPTALEELAKSEPAEADNAPKLNGGEEPSPIPSTEAEPEVASTQTSSEETVVEEKADNSHKADAKPSENNQKTDNVVE